MTVYKPTRGKTYRYDFWYQGRRHHDTTHQTTRTDAERVEAKAKERVRQEAGGIAIPSREDSPRIQEWAPRFYAYKVTRIDRPDAIAAILPAVLRFWGRGKSETGELTPQTLKAPQHDLRLLDPVLDPQWIVKFEAWLVDRGLSNQSKNHYRGLMRRMYQVALLPEFRQYTRVTVNPFIGLPNDPTVERTVILSPAQVRAALTVAPAHVRLAMAIAALAPKLRLRNILELRWSDIQPDPRPTKFRGKTLHFIVIQRHKTVRRTRRPLVSPITSELLEILKDAWTRAPTAAAVVTYHGHPLTSIRDGVKAAFKRAAIPYGRALEHGATFHTLRHAAATLLAEYEGDPLKFMDLTGHTDLATALKYRHLRPIGELPALERLSKQLRLTTALSGKRRLRAG